VYFEIALAAYVIDRLFGEFAFVRHPVVLMGDYIRWFEERFYRESIGRGAVLTFSLLLIVFALSAGAQWVLGSLGGDGGRSCGLLYGLSGSGEPDLQGCHAFGWYSLALGLVASTTIASKMLYDSVGEIMSHPEKIRYLVSRDTEGLLASDIRKAAIETYAENLSDGVIAPLFYLVLFGLPGAFVYKAINTLDSMVGYRNKRYEKFGKFAARLDDAANYIPARVTAVVIVLLLYVPLVWRADASASSGALRHKEHPHASSLSGWAAIPILRTIAKVFHDGQHHPSPNAGYPIAAMAYALGVMLGGPTRYFGQVKPKAWFGQGRSELENGDIERALRLQGRLDILAVMILAIGAWAI